MNTSITWEGKFDAAHHIPGHNKCGVVHGHTYRVRIRVEGTVQEDGMIVDFHELKDIVREYDHRDLNTIISQNPPTAENLSRLIALKVLSIGLHISRAVVRVHEGGDSYAESELVRT